MRDSPLTARAQGLDSRYWIRLSQVLYYKKILGDHAETWEGERWAASTHSGSHDWARSEIGMASWGHVGWSLKFMGVPLGVRKANAAGLELDEVSYARRGKNDLVFRSTR